MKIYTKTGDRGQTSLATGKRISKAAWQLEAYGTADELNSFVGLLRAELTAQTEAWAAEADEQLRWVQNRISDIGAILAGSDLAFDSAYAARLEEWMDAMQEVIPPLRAFVLPAGSEAIARCHVCRTVTRRLERNILRAAQEADGEVRPEVLCFVNRLSDYCFVLSRWIGYHAQIPPVTWEK